MKVDESGAPWPYEAVEPADDDAGVPTWECPGGLCECHPTEGDAERAPHSILFFDPGAKRMKGARCRVLENGELINEEHPYADGAGAVPVKVRSSTRVLELEWAPPELPIGPRFPYRKRYYLDLGETTEQGVQRRLHNLGFSVHSTIDENIRDFQRSYLQADTGLVDHVKFELSSFHDDGTLPPLPPSSAANAKTQLAFAKGPSRTIALAPGSGSGGSGSGGSVTGGVKAQGSATAVLVTKLRIRVRSRAGRLIDGARVNVDIGASTVERTTAKDGFVTISLTQDEIDFLTSPPNEVVVRVRKLHHGPEPGDRPKVTPADINVRVVLDPPGFADAQPAVGPANPAAPGLVVDKQGRFLDLVLRDAGMNRAAISPTVTRRLTGEEIQNELMFHHVSGAMALGPNSEFQFDHDTSSGDLGPCTANCTLKLPTVDQRVGVQMPIVAGITFFQLNDPLTGRIDLKAPETSFTGHRIFLGAKKGESLFDQRHIVGVVRLCHKLVRDHGIKAIYTQGFAQDGSTSAHGFGRAFDFGGASKEIPANPSSAVTVRLGIDFIVLFHWGLIPMWDPKTVAADRNTPSSWTRFPWNDRDRGQINYETDEAGTRIKLQYRLDPPPFKDFVATDPALAPLSDHFKTASKLFRDVYEFADAEYSSLIGNSPNNDLLGPLPSGMVDVPTPIDAQHAHLIEHPDYSHFGSGADGRQVHVNHIHFQLGPTFPTR